MQDKNLLKQELEILKEQLREEKIKANSLKITLNGAFGKLGSIYCSFYAPELLIAVTITGQLNLLSVIEELEKIKNVSVKSANTDGILVKYPPEAREKVLSVFTANARRTGFEYEETPYQTVAMKDVNSYIAICVDGKVKTKGLYAEAGLMKNPTMQVCSDAAVAWLKDGISPELFIRKANNPEDFVAIRNVKGGGVQHKKLVLVDDWEGGAGNWSYPGQSTKPLGRKSRPPPREVGQGGVPFGRVARWYMTTEALPPLSYVESGNKVPSTDGAKLCMTLPDVLPADLDRNWYIQNTYDILKDLGVTL